MRGASHVSLQFAVRTDRLWLKGFAAHGNAAYMSARRKTADRREFLAELTDEELVGLCRKGDQQAFTAVVDRYKNRVYWLVRRMVGSPDDEDLTQEVFLRVYQAIPGFQARSTFKTWLFRIAHNLCLTELKKRRRRGEHLSIEEEGDEKLHSLLPPVQGLEEEIERRDISLAVQNLVAELPLQYRTVLTLFYVQQASYEEIAETMGIPLGTVKTYMHRARLHLRDLVLAETDFRTDRHDKEASERPGRGDTT
jgi:RNA polymerase sigma-70 factor (ECF subfamily)